MNPIQENGKASVTLLITIIDVGSTKVISPDSLARARYLSVIEIFIGVFGYSFSGIVAEQYMSQQTIFSNWTL
jgi:hypothetical protein